MIRRKLVRCASAITGIFDSHLLFRLRTAFFRPRTEATAAPEATLSFSGVADNGARSKCAPLSAQSTLTEATVTWLDLHALQPPEIDAAAIELRLPRLADFMASVGRAQMREEGHTIRAYLQDILRRGWFEIVSPTSGRILRNGGSLVLIEKVVVFSFPDEPSLLLAVGDVSMAYPVCAALFPDRDLVLDVGGFAWGFSRRHISEMARIVEATHWKPGPVTGPINVVLGDVNFAHHVWNQLSALEEVVRGDVPDGIRMVVTYQPLGPIHDIFPELRKWPLSFKRFDELFALNGTGTVFSPLGGSIIAKSLVHRLRKFAEFRASEACRAIIAALSTVTGPVLWLSVRTRNRTVTNQHVLLVALGRCFLRAAPEGAIVIDGFSVPADIGDYPTYEQNEIRGVVSRDHAAAEAICRALDGESPTPRVHVAVGLTITDSILLARHASVYFCHHGTVQHKIGWFTATPGMVHTNRTVLDFNPAEWVAAQSEIAIPPLYLAEDLVVDAEFTSGKYAEFGQLLNQENYTITNIPAAISAFFKHASNANVAITPTQEDIMAITMDTLTAAEQSERSSTGTPAAVATSPNRHVLTVPEVLTPMGIFYTDFFQFIDTNLHPRSYFEIGTQHGRSLKAFTCGAVCVDPQFMLEPNVLGGRPQAHFYQMPSDVFFVDHDLRSIFRSGPDICFLDGMHRCEYLLRDFINTERLCHRGSLVFMHDCLPANTRMALRDFVPGDSSEGIWQHAWTGDVWKVPTILKKYRPDLKIYLLDCHPTGLVAISNLDPASTVLRDSYSTLLHELRSLDLDTYSIRRLWDELPVLSSHSLMASPEDLTMFLNIH